MQFLTILAVLAPAFAVVSAKCETNDYNPSWPKSRDEAKSLAAQYCKSQLSGSFQQNAIKYGCGPIANDRVKAKTFASFSVQWTGKASEASLAEADCVLRLQNEIGGCEHGGTTTTADWKFKSVPQYYNC